MRPGWAIAAIIALTLVSCGQDARPTVVDAVSGASLATARVTVLDSGRLLVEAEGYETRIAAPGDARVELPPLWRDRFLSEGTTRRAVREPKPCCPFKNPR